MIAVFPDHTHLLFNIVHSTCYMIGGHYYANEPTSYKTYHKLPNDLIICQLIYILLTEFIVLAHRIFMIMHSTVYTVYKVTAPD